MVPNHTSIYLGMPTRQFAEPEAWMAATCAAAVVGKQHKIVMVMIKREPCTLARNELVRQFLESDAMYLMFIDDDTPVPADAIVRLLALDVDIATGVTPFRYGAHGPAGLRANVVRRNGDVPARARAAEHLLSVQDHNKKSLWEPLWPDDVFDVWHCGTSCMLLRRRVFEEIPFPWFQYYQDDKGGFQTEDVHFCTKARNAGLTMRCDGMVRCGHINKVDLAQFAESPVQVCP